MASEVRQFTQEDLNDLVMCVEWQIVYLSDKVREGRENDLHWAVRRVRGRGQKPLRSNFSQLLPHPETDYQLAVTRWEGHERWLHDVVELIRTDIRTLWRLRKLLGELRG